MTLYYMLLGYYLQMTNIFLFVKKMDISKLKKKERKVISRHVGMQVLIQISYFRL